MADEEDARPSLTDKPLVSRDEAIRAGSKRYFTGIPCRQGHLAERSVGANNECQECKRIRDSAYAVRTKKQKAEYDRRYRAAHGERRAETRKRWLAETADQQFEYHRAYRERNRAVIAAKKAARLIERREVKRAWTAENRLHLREYARRRQKIDKERNPNYKLACALRVRLAVAVRAGTRTGSAVRDLGCPIDELRDHLERQFSPGMSWENWGRYGWQIDHRTPLASFNLSDPEQLKQACHYTNLQPLWAVDNASKGAKLSWADAHKARAG